MNIKMNLKHYCTYRLTLHIKLYWENCAVKCRVLKNSTVLHASSNKNSYSWPLGRVHHKTVRHMDMILSAYLHPSPSADASVLVNWKCTWSAAKDITLVYRKQNHITQLYIAIQQLLKNVCQHNNYGKIKLAKHSLQHTFKMLYFFRVP